MRVITSVSARTEISKYVVLSGDFSCSLYKLQLKFVQTTRVVCTDFAEVLRIGNVLSAFPSFDSNFQCSESEIRQSQELRGNKFYFNQRVAERVFGSKDGAYLVA